MPSMIGNTPKRGTRVRDKGGDVWRFGRTRWTCETPIDGIRVTAVGRLPTATLERWYGPLTGVEVRQ